MCITASGVERIFQPLHVKAFCIIHQHGIEAARRGVGQFREIVLRSADQAPLFVLIDAARSPAEISIAALTYFNENQYVVILHDQVDFTKAAAIVSCNQF